jgi:HAMP domain-containing protein
VVVQFVRTQVAAWASIPVSLARLLAALADAAETSVGLLQELDERAAATNRVLHSFEDPLVRLADVVDATLVDQTVEALARLPVLMSRAAALTDRADGLLSGLEAPVRALAPLASAVDAGRISGLVDRLEESLPGLVRLPDAESEVRRLRETLDRIYRAVDDIQGRFGVFPGANLLLRGDRHRAETERHRARTERAGTGRPGSERDEGEDGAT